MADHEPLATGHLPLATGHWPLATAKKLRCRLDSRRHYVRIRSVAAANRRRGTIIDAGWSSPVAREAHNLEVTGSNPVPATLRKSGRNRDLDYLPTVGSAA